MRSSISFENSNQSLNPKEKFLPKFNNDQSPEFICQELKQNKRKDSVQLPDLDEKPKLKRKSKSFDPNCKELSSIYGSIFNESNSDQFSSVKSNFNLSFFDSNSNFCEKNLQNMKRVEQKKESLDAWVVEDSKILEKLETNKSQGKKFTLNFNDSSLFANSN